VGRAASAPVTELRLGQPLTITKKNVDRYANTF
jgi:hypothetical protein